MVIPEGFEFQIRERSGLARKGIIIGAGEVDEEYRGPLKVVVRYLQPRREDAPNFWKVKVGDRIAQGKLERRIHQKIEEIYSEDFTDITSRGTGGFGSSGS